MLDKNYTSELKEIILDRLLHHSHIINMNGKSYGLKEKLIDANEKNGKS